MMVVHAGIALSGTFERQSAQSSAAAAVLMIVAAPASRNALTMARPGRIGRWGVVMAVNSNR